MLYTDGTRSTGKKCGKSSGYGDRFLFLPIICSWRRGRGRERRGLLLAVDVAEPGRGNGGGGRGGEGEELLPPGPHGGGHRGVGGSERALLGQQALDLALLLRRLPPQRHRRAQQQTADHLLPVLRQLGPDPAQRRLHRAPTLSPGLSSLDRLQPFFFT